MIEHNDKFSSSPSSDEASSVEDTSSSHDASSSDGVPSSRSSRTFQSSQPRKKTGFASLSQAGDEEEDFSVIDAIGGPRGVIESMLPGVVFVALFVITSDVRLTVIVSAVIAVLQVVIRLLQRQSVMGAISGLIAVGICLIWAWKSNEARNYYMFGFISNAVYIVVLSISLVVRIPGLGAMIEFIRTLPTERLREWLHDWKNDHDLNRAYTIITAMWIGVFALRLIVQVPLYLTEHVTMLGTARLLMGIPFWALAIWVSYLIIATPLHEHITMQDHTASEEHVVVNEQQGVQEGDASDETKGRSSADDFTAFEK
jgi:hypothetical protein